MNTFGDIANIDGFSIKQMNVEDIRDIENMIPKNGIVDINIAERGVAATLEGQNKCQEKLVKVERWLGFLEGKKNKAWAKAALEDAEKKGHKTAKAKEWYAGSDDDYIIILNQITITKACKKWLENKASYFSGWHYAFKTFLRRDYLLEKSANGTVSGYTNSMAGGLDQENSPDMVGDMDW